MSGHTTVTPVLGTLHVLEVPIPFPMKTVTITVDTAAPVTLIDCGIDTPEARAGLEDLGAQIVLLDIEARHGAAYWQHWDEWLPRVLAQMHANGLPQELHGSQEQFHRVLRGMVTPAKLWSTVQEGDRVELAGRSWEVLWLPGHADGHLALWLPEEGLMIAADTILPRITPNIGLYAYSRPDPLADYFGTLKQYEELSPRRAIVGHHGPEMGDVAARASSLRDHHHERLDFLRRTVAEVPGNAYQVSQKMFTRPLNEANLRFALAETLAHLEHLHLRGELGRTDEHGVWVYHSS